MKPVEEMTDEELAYWTARAIEILERVTLLRMERGLADADG